MSTDGPFPPEFFQKPKDITNGLAKIVANAARFELVIPETFTGPRERVDLGCLSALQAAVNHEMGAVLSELRQVRSLCEEQAFHV